MWFPFNWKCIETAIFKRNFLPFLIFPSTSTLHCLFLSLRYWDLLAAVCWVTLACVWAILEYQVWNKKQRWRSEKMVKHSCDRIRKWVVLKRFWHSCQVGLKINCYKVFLTDFGSIWYGEQHLKHFVKL